LEWRERRQERSEWIGDRCRLSIREEAGWGRRTFLEVKLSGAWEDACCGNEACCVVFLYPFGFAPDPCFSDMAAFVTALWFVVWRVSIVDVMIR